MDGKELAASMMRLVEVGASVRIGSIRDNDLDESGDRSCVIITADGNTIAALAADFTSALEIAILDLAVRRLSDPAEFV